jgi:uncharacterized protein YjbK
MKRRKCLMKDHWDFLEIEVKVIPKPPYGRLVELAQSVAPPGFRMIRKPHVAFFDLYFDSADFGLAAGDAYLRVRFDRRSLKRSGKYKLFYKDNPSAKPGEKFLSRREVRTDLSLEELLALGTAPPQGSAGSLAHEVLARGGGDQVLRPVCVVSSFRRYFTMHSDDATKTDCMNLSLENSTAFRAKDFDVEKLLRTGYIDAPLDAPTLDFELSEAELTVEDSEEANQSFAALVALFEKEYELVTWSKYRQCLRGLDLYAGR